MLNIKSFSVIDKDKVQGKVHLIGCGALGSMIGQNLLRLNLGSKLVVYDDDVVEDVNLNNQAYFAHHVEQPKVEAFNDLAQMIDPSLVVETENKRVNWVSAGDDDVVIIAIDDYTARKKILKTMTGRPLVICGGISSIGGNIEVVRGDYKKLANEYADIEGEPEYDPNDLTPCGSPISIYHRISFAASIACDEIIKNLTDEGDVYKNIVFDTPNLIVMEV